MTAPTPRPASAATEPTSYEVGRFTLRLEHRSFGGDGGLALRVYGPLGGERRELLRFDCFAERPHYHVGLAVGSRIDPIEADDALEWSVGALRTRLTELLSEAGAELPNVDETGGFAAALEQARQRALGWRRA